MADDGRKGASWQAWIALILIIFVIIALIVLYILYFNKVSDLVNNGIPLKVQTGVTTGTTDTMITGGNNLYIGASTSAVTLTLASSSSGNEQGDLIYIKNNSADIITVAAGSGITLSPSNITNEKDVESGETAVYVATTTNTFLRLQ